MENQEIVLGPPGTGKTTYLLSKVDEALKADVLPSKIGFLAFTKKAATEAMERALVKFHLPRKAFPYFRTLHSLAYQQLGLSMSQVMSRDHYKELGNIMGMDIQGYINPNEGLVVSTTKDDRLVFLENLSRVKCVPLIDVWGETKDDIRFSELERYQRGLLEYKKARHLIDYTDMISRYIRDCEAPELEYLFVDEAQDLSELQWQMVDKLVKKAANVIIAGDDDQAIYNWAGASVDRFLNLEGNQTVLRNSHRIPQKVHEIANRVSNKIRKRYRKDFYSRDYTGDVQWHSNLSTVDLSSGEWLVLARNKYLLKEVQDICEQSGYNFSASGIVNIDPKISYAIKFWESYRKQSTPLLPEDEDMLLEYMYRKNLTEDLPWDQVFTKINKAKRERLLAMTRRGEDISKPPRIKISTIHGAKGGEADNVLLITDVSWKAKKEAEKNPDDELRVLYVGVTRTRKVLHILHPQTTVYFDLG